MKRNLFLPVLIITILFASCKKSGTSGLLVPGDAAIVFHINNASLSSKLSWEEIRQTNWYKELSKHADDSLAQKILNDPAQSGVDTKADFVIFLSAHGKNGYLVFEGSLKDAAAFEAFNKKMHKSGTAAKDGPISFMLLDETAILTWNSTHFTYVTGVPMPDMQGIAERKQAGLDHHTIIPADSLKLFGKNILSLKASDKLDKDSRFVSLIKDGSDVHLWMNTEKYYAGMLGPMVAMMGNIAALTKGNISTASYKFDNGKITMDSKQYYGKEMAEFMSNYNVKPVSAETVARIPSQNVVAALAMNYPPEAVQGFLKFLGIDGLANMFIAKTGYSLAEFEKAMKGEVLFAVTDFSLKTKDDTLKYGEGEPMIFPKTKPDANVLLATAVKDKVAFDKLITILTDKIKEETMGEIPPSITYKSDNNWFAIGNSPEQVNQFLAGGSTKAAFADKMSGHPFGLYIDVKKILQVTSTTARDSVRKAAFAVALDTWEEVKAWGGEYNNKSTEFHAEITMVDKNTNSLKQLNNFIDKMATIFINEEKAKKETEMKGF